MCTSRQYREVDKLSDLKNVKLEFIGRHGGNSIQEKLKASCERTVRLADFVSNLKLDYALSFSSPECARVAFGLGVKHICVNDSPHSDKVNRLTLPLSEILFTPWIIPFSAWRNYGIINSRIIRYKALDPVVWIKRRHAKKIKKQEFGLNPKKQTITLRLEESKASYLLSHDKTYARKIIDSLILNFGDCEIFILGRYDDQIEMIKNTYGAKVKVADDVLNGLDLLTVTDLFVGMGGTMTCESALLGIPTIAAFQGPDLYTEKYLVKKGLLLKARNAEQIVKLARELMVHNEIKTRFRAKAEKIVSEMEDPVKFIADNLEGPQSKNTKY